MKKRAARQWKEALVAASRLGMRGLQGSRAPPSTRANIVMDMRIIDRQPIREIVEWNFMSLTLSSCRYRFIPFYPLWNISSRGLLGHGLSSVCSCKVSPPSALFPLDPSAVCCRPPRSKV